MSFACKSNTRKFIPLKRIPPDRNSLEFAIRRVNLVVHGMVHCSEGNYNQLDVLKYGWKLEAGIPVPIWYDGEALPSSENVNQQPQPCAGSMTDISTATSIEEDIPGVLDGFAFVTEDPESDDDAIVLLSDDSSVEDD